MSWSDVTLETSSWADVNIPAQYVVDQNEDIITDQNGSPLVVQGDSSISTEWTTIT